MKVSNTNLNPALTTNLDKTKAQRTDAQTSTEKAKQSLNPEEIKDSAKINVSTRAQEIQKAKELATPGDGVDEAKVARLQSLIDSGQYQVDADALADRILAEHGTLRD